MGLLSSVRGLGACVRMLRRSSVHLVTVVGASHQSTAASEDVGGEHRRRRRSATVSVPEVQLRDVGNGVLGVVGAAAAVVEALVVEEALEDAPADLDHGVVGVLVFAVVDGCDSHALEHRRGSYMRREALFDARV
ncbi:hypothetical protein BHE74_00044880 [Ensete ventricosum]|nr:hypothetical protein GW17_00059093 [Ensete ventricosum]RWW49010.1 hypothetical protein BHE74_00044880 [Ensete ventricosum]RZS14727.1 hypothetical protein BHM03_00046459 [Ensete ventricosum]